MSTHDNAPPPDEWQPESRCCPFDAKTCSVCSVAENAQHKVFLLGENIILGDQ